MDLTGRIAVVTGGARGIGAAYSAALAEDGATVVVADIDVAAAEETAARITSARGRAVAMAVDVSDRASTQDLAQRILRELGPVSILINNAAIYHGLRLDPVLDVDVEYWRRVMAVNLDGALLMVQAVAPQMIELGWGRVINQASIAAYGAAGVYGVSKLALIGLTICQAVELGPSGITVNAIAPGPIDTEATRQVVGTTRTEELLSRAAIRQLHGPEVLVGTLRYLLSDDAAWVTGQTLIVDGGITRRV